MSPHGSKTTQSEVSFSRSHPFFGVTQLTFRVLLERELGSLAPVGAQIFSVNCREFIKNIRALIRVFVFVYIPYLCSFCIGIFENYFVLQTGYSLE
jgi:hypothetical protein